MSTYLRPTPAAASNPPSQGWLTERGSIVAGGHWLRHNALVLVAAPLVAAVSFLALSQSSAPSIPAITLSADPLYAATTGDKPALALALSVEFPTVGAQYVDPDNNNSGTSDDVTYSPTIEYLGYYDAESCYTYDDAGTGAPSGQTANYKRFVRRGPALPLSTPDSSNPTWTSRMCWDGSKSYSKDDGTTPAYSTTTNDGFSGNFLNWASSSAIDMLRLSLTGGDRVIDTSTLTVLQRAIIPDGDPISMGNSSNFPSKRLYRSGTSRAITSTNFAAASYASGVAYFGAVPSSMASTAGSNDIFVANTLNRIYFGTSKTGNNSGGFGAYTLGSSGSSSGAYQIGTVTTSSVALPGSVTYQKGTTSTSSTALPGVAGYQNNTVTSSSNSVPEGNQFGSVSSSSSAPTGVTDCSTQNSTCKLPAGTYEIWYGKISSWKWALATGDVACNNTRFGYGSGTGRTCKYKASSSSLTNTSSYCADKNGTCSLPSGTKEVWYGVNGTWRVAAASGAVPCTDAVFSPASSTSAYKCYYKTYSGTSWTPAPTPTFCANENGTCTLPSGTWEVWYGVGSTWKNAPATGAVPCTNAVWGDPAVGIGKSCYYRSYSGTWTPTASVTECAGENGTCTLPTGVREVWYGAAGYWKVAPATGAVPCTNAVFGDPIVGTVKKCYYGSYSGSWTPTTSTSTALNGDGYFFARVQVCDRDASTYALKDKRYWNLCTQYSDGASTPHASYKPTGAIQKYSDQLRLAAFGYLMDQNTSRYGGVLRAPIKYVGSRTYDINGNLSGSNANQEWDSTTGVFIPNPDGNTTVQTTDGRGVYLSGVISYVNQFGRTGSVAGRYKKYDPVGELYYQALRYLQGLPPSTDAISGLPGTTSLYDGYPAFTTWTDPYGGGRSSTSDYSCLKSNIVVIGDKNAWDYNSRLPVANAANNIPDIAYWDGIAAKFESNTSGTYLDGAGTSRSISNPNSANTSGLTSASGNTNWVGSAYWAHTHDIRGTSWTNATSAGTAGTTLQRPGLRVKTFAFDVNEYGGSNNASTRRSSNQFFRAAKYGGFESDPSNTAKNPYNTYGNPFVNEKDGSNDNYVWVDTDTRTTRTGEANTYFLQSDARGVLSAFDDIFARASTTAYNIGGGANDSKSIAVASTIYQGKFDTSDWSGDLEARARATNTLTWSAAARLSAMTAPATSRNIVMGKVGATANPAGVNFNWASIETSVQTALNGSDGLGAERLNYLRGDKSKEGSPFRARKVLLGDIINSGVVYSGKPSTDISASGYNSFASSNAGRTAAVFVGANDGMLHAFNAATGDELFAYIPSWLGAKLKALTGADYGTSTNPHQSYVDSVPAVGEAQLGSAWKTVLVNGTGGGGQGVFALDVTDPSNFSDSKVLWEFTHTDDPDLGNVTGRTQILKLRTNAYNASGATYKWFAVVGSGVNNYVSDSAGLYSSTGKPTLFLLDLNKTPGASWTLNSNYYKIQLPIDSTLSASKPTGLINFNAQLGRNGEVTQMYLGDLHGRLWKLDFSLSGGVSEWNINKLSSFNKGTVSSPDPYPMYIAKDGSGNMQPIVAAPLVIPGDVRDSRYVFFGTGKYYEIADKTSTTVQTEYMVYDNGTTSGDTLSGGATRSAAISSRLRLKQGTANAGTGVISTPAFTPGRAATDVNTETVRSGWYADLPTSGERQISDAATPPLSKKVVVNSTIPGSAGGSGCAAGKDSGRTYNIDIATGNGTSSESAVGLLGEAMVVERPDLTTQTISDNTLGRLKITTSEVYQLGSQGWKLASTESTPARNGRQSWRQVNNYQDLRHAP